MKKLLLFGAGKIGRSFIAPIFEKSGYEIVFVDIDRTLINSLNNANSYEVIILDSNHPEKEEKYFVSNISAIHLSDIDGIVKNIIESDIIVTSVGKRGLQDLPKLLAKGLNKRYQIRKDDSIDIIFAENIRKAAKLFRKDIEEYIPDIPIDNYIGLIETSIGKMVPIIPEKQLKKDPLSVIAEPYNNLIVDKLGFINGVPEIKELAPKEHMKAWVDRKIFIHNMGHAALSYNACFFDENIKYTWEALKHKPLLNITRDTMLQSAAILVKKYPNEFTKSQLTEHIDDLLDRFSNKSLGDTIFRVGCDLSRKLHLDDRLMVPILTAIDLNIEYSLILESWVKGCYFKGEDENGNRHTEDDKFKQKFKHNPINILSDYCKLDREKYAKIYTEVHEIMVGLEISSKS